MSDQPIADEWGPSLAPLLGGTAVAWTREQAGSDIVLSTLDPTGQKLDGNGKACDPALADCGIFPLTTSGAASQPSLERPQVDPRTADPTEGQVGVAFVDTRNYPCPGPGPCVVRNDVYWKKVQSNGVELIPEKRITAVGANRRFAFPRLAFDGVHEALVWRDESSGTNTDFYFATLDSLGIVASPAVKIGSVSGTSVPLAAPDLLWNGSEFALASATGSDLTSTIVFQRNASNGQPTLAPKGITFGGTACTPAIAYDGQHYAVVWQAGCGNSGANLAFQLIDADGIRVQSDGSSCGSSLDPMCGVQLLTQNTKDVAAYPDMVWAGGHTFAMVWMQGPPVTASSPAANEIYFARVECTPP
jgi:hypothetical protein